MTEALGDIITWILAAAFTLLLMFLVAYGLGQAAGRKMPPIDGMEE